MSSDLGIEQLVTDHGDHRVRLLHVNGQTMFPIAGMSGGLVCAVMVYLRAGWLDDIDLGRGGPAKHKCGHSWAVQLNPWAGDPSHERSLLRDALVAFSEYLDAENFL